MIITIKGIYHERTEDAIFVGALICANNCQYKCENCFNEDLKNVTGYSLQDYEIINKVLANKFNKGIILAGLEWTLQPIEMIRLIELALENSLQVILYTGMEKEDLFKKFPQLLDLNIYVKCGKYIKKLHSDTYKMYGVKLASTNQEIIKCGR